MQTLQHNRICLCLVTGVVIFVLQRKSMSTLGGGGGVKMGCFLLMSLMDGLYNCNLLYYTSYNSTFFT